MYIQSIRELSKDVTQNYCPPYLSVRSALIILAVPRGFLENQYLTAALNVVGFAYV